MIHSIAGVFTKIVQKLLCVYEEEEEDEKYN